MVNEWLWICPNSNVFYYFTTCSPDWIKSHYAIKLGGLHTKYNCLLKKITKSWETVLMDYFKQNIVKCEKILSWSNITLYFAFLWQIMTAIMEVNIWYKNTNCSAQFGTGKHQTNTYNVQICTAVTVGTKPLLLGHLMSVATTTKNIQSDG